jgi:formylglycine-generating enzyme required for sulfatase activity
MVAIPGGTFTMGSPVNERGSSSNERPQHNVTVPPFFMGKYPVTQAQWKVIASRTDLKVKIDLDPDPSRFKGGNRPVERVTWYEAVEFCQRLSKLTGRDYRLPSEAEWEYACRSVISYQSSVISEELSLEEWNEKYNQPFYFGETITGELANYDASSTYADEPKGEYRQKTTPVGQFPPNAFGLYDMHGNVWEWCADDWHDNYKNAPTDGSAWIDDNEEENTNSENEAYTGKNKKNQPYTLLRGGSWYLQPEDCRSASRNYGVRRVIRIIGYGFRVVCGFGSTL